MPLEETRKWKKHEQKQLLQLQEIYGMNRPSDITYQLKKIYGIEKTPQQVLARMQQIDPNIDRSQFTYEQFIQAWELQKSIGFNWNLIGQKLNKNKIVVREKLRCKYKSFLRKLNKIFGQFRSHNKEKLHNLKIETISLSLQLYQDTNPPKDEQYLQVQEKAKQFVELFDKMFRIQYEDDEDLFDKLVKFTNKQQIQQILEHLYLLNTMINIAYNNNLNRKNKKEYYNPYYYLNKNDQSKFYKFRYAKTWEEAEDLIILPKEQLDQNLNPLQLTQHEIQLIKDSPLYKKLFPNTQKIFLDFYNKAVQNYYDNKNYTYVINENNKLHQVQKDLNIEKIERQKQNFALPLWKKNKNEREVHITAYSQRFLNDFLEGVAQ